MLAYLLRYTHRVAISNRRLISADASGVTFRYKDYRIEGPDRYKTMTIVPGEFIRRFLLLANGEDTRAEKIDRARQLIAATGQVAPARKPSEDAMSEETTRPEGVVHPCPHCGGRMLIIEWFEAPCSPSHPRPAPVSILTINTS